MPQPEPPQRAYSRECTIHPLWVLVMLACSIKQLQHQFFCQPAPTTQVIVGAGCCCSYAACTTMIIKAHYIIIVVHFYKLLYISLWRWIDYISSILYVSSLFGYGGL